MQLPLSSSSLLLFLLSFLSPLSTCRGALTYQVMEEKGDTVGGEDPAASANETFVFTNTRHFNVKNVAVVDLQVNSTIFDWCNLHSYTPEGVAKVLDYHRITADMIDQGLQWVALNLGGACSGDERVYPPLMTSYITQFDQTLAPFNSNLGCVGVLSGAYDFPSLYAYCNLGGVDMRTGMVNEGLFLFRRSEDIDLMKRFVGTTVTIFVALLSWEDDFLQLKAAVAAYRDRNLTLMISSLEADLDTVNGGYIDPSFPFYHYHRAMCGLACALCVAAIVHNVVVIKAYWKSGRRGFNYGLLCLLLALVGNILRFFVVLDPLSFMGLINYDQYFVYVSLSDSFHVFSSMASMIVWLDMIAGLRASSKMKFRTILWTQLLWVRFALFASLIVASVADLYFTYTTNIIEDPLGIVSFTIFSSIDDDGAEVYGTGVYVDCFIKFCEFALLSVSEICIACAVILQVNNLVKDIDMEDFQTTEYELVRVVRVFCMDANKRDTKTTPDSAESIRGTVATKAGVTTAVTPSHSSSLMKSSVAVAPSPQLLQPPHQSPATANTTAETVKPTAKRVGNQLERYKLHVAQRLASLSFYMILSGVVMFISSIFILVYGLGAMWILENREPYAANFFFLFPFVLLQVSSMMEVCAVLETLKKAH